MKLLLESILYCLVFTITVRIFAGKDARGCLYFYPKEYQEIAYERGVADREKVARSRKIFLIVFTSIMALLLVVLLKKNGVKGFKETYLQALLFLEVMNLYDGIVIDRIWVGNDPFWKIKGMEDTPYVQTWKEAIRKRGFLALFWIFAAALIAAIVIHI